MPETTVAELKYLIERQREEIRTINEVGRLLSAATEPSELVRSVASYLKRAFPLAFCGVLVLEPRKLQAIRFAKIAEVDVASAVQTICAKATEQSPSEPVDVSRLAHTVEDQLGGGGEGPIVYLRSHHIAPLRFSTRITGLLAVFSGKPDAFTREDQHVIDIVADQLGAALRNAVLLEELQRADRLKNELLMVISHELRIPLTSIKEGVNLVIEGALGPTTPEQVDFLKTVNENALRLDTLVEKVVVTTKLITNQLEYAFSMIDVQPLLEELRKECEATASAKHVTLEVQAPQRVLRLQADASRLKRALLHILENAIQATSDGGRVTIACASAPGAVVIRIEDTGVGISPEELPRMFEQFRLIGGIDDRKTGGLGLGLFIAKGLIDAHHGTIRLESEVGKGTVATIQLPLAQLPVAARAG